MRLSYGRLPVALVPLSVKQISDIASPINWLPNVPVALMIAPINVGWLTIAVSSMRK